MPPAASADPRTTILSEPRTVVSRCAMTIVVRGAPATSASSASCTKRSFSVSSALVASSRIRIAGLRNAARAMAIRCFCPPESLEFLPPTTVRTVGEGRDRRAPCRRARRPPRRRRHGVRLLSRRAGGDVRADRVLEQQRLLRHGPIAARSASIGSRRCRGRPATRARRRGRRSAPAACRLWTCRGRTRPPARQSRPRGRAGPAPRTRAARRTRSARLGTR